ncbi:MAG: hypothetical protein ACRD35_09495 [Candidatus Acidiferrales bacterium]
MPRDPEGELHREEVDVLRALLSTTLSPRERKKLLALLANYRFADPLHQLIFEALSERPGEKPARLREELPARLTRKGFPEVDFERYLAPPQSPAAEILARVQAWLTGDEKRTGPRPNQARIC